MFIRTYILQLRNIRLPKKAASKSQLQIRFTWLCNTGAKFRQIQFDFLLRYFISDAT